MNQQRSPWSCYQPRFLALALGMALIILGAAWVGHGFAKGSAGRIAIALVEGAASAVVVVAIVRNIRNLDELQQRIQLEALAFSFAGTGILVTGYGFLVTAGLPDIDWGAAVWPGMCVLWAIGLAISTRKYR